jgi:hypothetical protein
MFCQFCFVHKEIAILGSLLQMSTESQYRKIVYVQLYAGRSMTTVIPNRGRCYAADSAGDYRVENLWQNYL